MENQTTRKVIILTNSEAEFGFFADIGPGIYRLERMPRSVEGYFKIIDKFIGSDYEIILLTYKFTLGKILEIMRDPASIPDISNWLILKFYHNSEEVKDQDTSWKFTFFTRLEYPKASQVKWAELMELLDIYFPVEDEDL